MGVGAPVVDAHHHRSTGALVHDAHPGAEGQGAVGGRKGVGVEGLAACGLPSVKAGAVPGGPVALNRPSGPVVRFRLNEGGRRRTGAESEETDDETRDLALFHNAFPCCCARARKMFSNEARIRPSMKLPS